MDVTSRPYEDASPSFTSTLRPLTPNYPTTPQSCPLAEIVSMNSPPPTGLGLLNYATRSANAQLAMCSPPDSLIQPSPVWQHANNCFTGPPSDFAGYPTLALYEDIHTVPTTSAPPHSMSSAHNDTSSAFGFLSPAQTVKRHSSPVSQHTTTAHNVHPDFRVPSAHRRSPILIKQESEQDWDRITTGGGLSGSLVAAEDFTFAQQTFGASGPSRQNYADNGVLLGMPSMMDRNADRRQPPTTVIPSTRVDRGGTNSMRTNNGGKGTKKPRCLPNGKYECDQCRKQFTRSSNCRSHMKIHDPNRKYPHRCTVSQCTKKFSRKTDLVRHVDSVHRKLRRFGCDQCGYYFARQDTLRRHREDGCRRRHQQQHELRELPSTSAVSISVSGNAIMAYPTNSSAYQDTAIFSAHQPQLASSLLPNPYVDNNDADTYSDFTGY